MLIFAVHYISSYKIGIGDRNSDLQDYFEDEHEGYFGSLDSDEEINKDRSIYICLMAIKLKLGCRTYLQKVRGLRLSLYIPCLSELGRRRMSKIKLTKPRSCRRPL